MTAKYTFTRHETGENETSENDSVGKAIFEANQDLMFKEAWPVMIECGEDRLGFVEIQGIIDAVSEVVTEATHEQFQIAFEYWKENNKS